MVISKMTGREVVKIFDTFDDLYQLKHIAWYCTKGL